jgi:hypothetical protein
VAAPAMGAGNAQIGANVSPASQTDVRAEGDDAHTHWGGHCCAAMNSKQAFLTRDASLGSLCYLVYEVRWLSSQLQDLIILLLHIDDQFAASGSKAPIYPSTQ